MAGRIVKAMQKLRAGKEEHERAVEDYETRISGVENNCNFNHQYGDQCDNKKGDDKQRLFCRIK